MALPGDIMREAAYTSMYQSRQGVSNPWMAIPGVIASVGNFMGEMQRFNESKRRYEEQMALEREKFAWQQKLGVGSERRAESAEAREQAKFEHEQKLYPSEAEYRKLLVDELKGRLKEQGVKSKARELMTRAALELSTQDLSSMDFDKKINLLFNTIIKLVPEGQREDVAPGMLEYMSTWQWARPSKLETTTDPFATAKQQSILAEMLQAQAAITADPVARRSLQDRAMKAATDALNQSMGGEASPEYEKGYQDLPNMSDDEKIKWAIGVEKSARSYLTEPLGATQFFTFLTSEQPGMVEPALGGSLRRGEDISQLGSNLRGWVLEELGKGNREAIHALRYLDAQGNIDVRKAEGAIDADKLLKRMSILEARYKGDVDRALRDLIEYAGWAGMSPEPKGRIIRRGDKTFYKTEVYQPQAGVLVGPGMPMTPNIPSLFTPSTQYEREMSPMDAAAIAIKQMFMNKQGKAFEQKGSYSDMLKASIPTVDEFRKLREMIMKQSGK